MGARARATLGTENGQDPNTRVVLESPDYRRRCWSHQRVMLILFCANFFARSDFLQVS